MAKKNIYAQFWGDMLPVSLFAANCGALDCFVLSEVRLCVFGQIESNDLLVSSSNLAVVDTVLQLSDWVLRIV